MRVFALLAVVIAAVSSPVLLTAQTASVNTAQTATVNTADAVLRPGDAIHIQVWQKEDLSGEFPVSADGTIAHPYYMGIVVAGLPFASVVERVRSHIGQFANEQLVLVEPLFQVSVGGEVRDPNVYKLRPETTITQAVMQAGGPTADGRMDRVRILRGGETMVVDLTRPEEGLAQTPIHSGDRILVGRKVSFVREYVAPFSSIVGATVSVAYLIFRYF